MAQPSLPLPGEFNLALPSSAVQIVIRKACGPAV